MMVARTWFLMDWLKPMAPALIVLSACPLWAQADPPAADPAAVAALQALVKSLREQPGIRVANTLTIELIDPATGQKSAGEEVTAEFVRRQDGAGLVKVRDMQCTFADGNFYATHSSSGEKSYYTTKIDDVPYWTLIDVFRDLPYPHAALLWGDAAIEDLCMELNPRTPELVPTNVNDELIDGKSVRTLTLASDDGSLTFTIDPQTMLITSAVHEVTSGPFVRDGVKMVSTYAFENETFRPEDKDPRFAFDPGNRQRVDMVAALVERKPGPGQDGDDGGEGGPMMGGGGLVGKPAPAFVLTNAEGKAVDLKDLEGQVVILDFWATWCGPCVAALPALHQAAAWAREQNLPVTVLAVNTMEQGASPDAKLAKVKQFWNAKKFTLPVLMDYSSQTAAEYGVRGIPATFIIRSDGIVHANHVGFPGSADALLNMLKKDIREAIDALEQKEAPALGGEKTPEGAGAR